MISAAGSTVIGFSLSGQTIPAGIGNLLDLVISGYPTRLSNLIISDASGLAIDFYFDNGGCSDSQFDCGDGLCINSSSVCDGYSDCINGIDESDCLDDGDGDGDIGVTRTKAGVRLYRPRSKKKPKPWEETLPEPEEVPSTAVKARGDLESHPPDCVRTEGTILKCLRVDARCNE